MRFAVALLACIGLAAMIGTLLPQQQPELRYIEQFGPFWSQLLRLAGLDRLYAAGWFVAMWGLLVLSICLCLLRSSPRLWADWRSHREQLALDRLRAMPHYRQARLPGTAAERAQAAAAQLRADGWRVRLQARTRAGQPAGWMVAAQRGTLRKLGYLATHAAIVLIAVGGLIDGSGLLRGWMWLKGVSPYQGSGLMAEVPARHWLGLDTPSYRASLAVAEGTQSALALIDQGAGVVLQPLPFAIELQRFTIERHANGTPRQYRSAVLLHDRLSGRRVPLEIAVNQPALYQGVHIYQSGFEDGGSRLALQLQAPGDARQTLALQATMGHSVALQLPWRAGEHWQLELLDLQPSTRLALPPEPAVAAERAPVGQLPGWAQGAAARPPAGPAARELGPSLRYRLRDPAGQARDYIVYQQALEVGDGLPVYLYGVYPPAGQATAEPAYWRLPADLLAPAGGQADFWRLRAALQHAQLRERALDRYVEAALDGAPSGAAALRASAARVLQVFADAALGPAPAPAWAADPERAPVPLSGLQALADLVEQQVPAAQREQASRLLGGLLRGVLYQLLREARAAEGLPTGAPDPLDRYLQLAVLALSDARLYPAPLLLQLGDFQQRQASVFQIRRAPGQPWVYLGCLLLVLGVFAMLYGRERRLWLWQAGTKDAEPVLQAELAYRSARPSTRGAQEFEHWCQRLLAPVALDATTAAGQSSPL
jgi:cytochrome c biogenesis protein